MQKIKFDPVSKDRLFYDQYRYSICISLAEARCLRSKTAEELAKIICYHNRAPRLWGNNRPIIEGKTLNHLNQMFDQLNRVRDKVKIIISYNILYIYSNNMDILKNLARLPYVIYNNGAEAQVDRPRDVVLRSNPKYKLRSYFREQLISSDESQRLINFLQQSRDYYGVTNYFFTILRKRYIPRYMFIDYNDEKDITMLSLICPGLIRKTMPVQAK
jgi:hypothetical protein